MVFLYDFAMLDNVDSNVRVYFSKNFNSLWKFCPFNFDQVFSAAFAASDIFAAKRQMPNYLPIPEADTVPAPFQRECGLK